MYQIKKTNRFNKHIKKLAKQGKDLAKLALVIDILATGAKLPEKYSNHKLTGNWHQHQELHIEPDWLLIYKIEKGILILELTATGSHSELFNL